jgi:hypothetical protein
VVSGKGLSWFRVTVMLKMPYKSCLFYTYPHPITRARDLNLELTLLTPSQPADSRGGSAPRRLKPTQPALPPTGPPSGRTRTLQPNYRAPPGAAENEPRRWNHRGIAGRSLHAWPWTSSRPWARNCSISGSSAPMAPCCCGKGGAPNRCLSRCCGYGVKTLIAAISMFGLPVSMGLAWSMTSRPMRSRA